MTLVQRAERIAQDVLRAWFDDEAGFKDMNQTARKKAVVAALRQLQEHEEQRVSP